MRRPDGSPWLLGSGGFGAVYKALHHGVQPVAVKVVNGLMSEADFEREVALLRACHSVNM